MTGTQLLSVIVSGTDVCQTMDPMSGADQLLLQYVNLRDFSSPDIKTHGAVYVLPLSVNR